MAIRLKEEIQLIRRLGVRVARDSRLHNMHIRQLHLRRLPRQVAELRDGIRHPHPLEATPGTEPNPRAVRPNSVHHRAGHLEREARPLLNTPAPRIRALVRRILGELINKVPVRAMDLNTIEARGDGIARSLRVVANQGVDLLLGESARRRRLLVRGDVAARHEVEAAFSLEDFGVGDPAQTPQLHVDVGPLRVHGVSHLAPLSDLRLAPDPRHVGVAACARRDERRFGDEKGAGDDGALFVVLLDYGEGDVVVVHTESGHGGHGQAVAEPHAPDLDGGEEFRHGGSLHLDLGITPRRDDSATYTLYGTDWGEAVRGGRPLAFYPTSSGEHCALKTTLQRL